MRKKAGSASKGNEGESEKWEWLLVEPDLQFDVKNEGVATYITKVTSFYADAIVDPARIDEYGLKGSERYLDLYMKDGSKHRQNST